MTGLDTLRDRGWWTASWSKGVDHPHTEADHREIGARIWARHPDPATAELMAVVAALVAEGHDLLDLLRDARGHLSESDWDDRALVVRIDAVLAAAGESSSVTLDTYSWVIDREVDAP